jgi:hypothetical protein
MIGVSADRLSRAVLTFQDRRSSVAWLKADPLVPAISTEGFSVSIFVTPGSDVVPGLPSRQRPAEAWGWERAQMVVAREQRRSERRMLALSAQLRLSTRRTGQTTPQGVPVSAVELIGEAPAAFEVEVEPAREVVRVKPVGELDLTTSRCWRTRSESCWRSGLSS